MQNMSKQVALANFKKGLCTVLLISFYTSRYIWDL